MLNRMTIDYLQGSKPQDLYHSCKPRCKPKWQVRSFRLPSGQPRSGPQTSEGRSRSQWYMHLIWVTTFPIRKKKHTTATKSVFPPRFSCMVQVVVHLDARYDDLDFQCSEHSLNEPNTVVWGGFVGIDGA